MRVAALKSRKRVNQASYSLAQKIRLYDDGNDYPQRILKALDNSSTATSCLDIYHKFIRGEGFEDERLLTFRANRKETFSQLHSKIAKDWAIFKGYAIHVAYNGLLEPIAYHHIPFEHCRWQVDGEKLPTGKVAIHPDWTKESGRTFKNADIVYLSQYNPNKEVVFAEIQEAGGFENYKGQIFYYIEEPIGSYPLAHADSVVTWMETEDSCANVLFRNARFNFLPAGILTVRKKQVFNDQNEVVSDDSAFENAQKFQGDENALKMLVVEIDTDEEKPDFTPFPAQNLDKQFEFTIKTAEEKIAKFYQIPPELRGVDTGSGFSPDRITNAYDYYNSNTQSERNTLQESYAKLFGATGYVFNIKPKSYIISTKTTGNE